MVCDSTRITPQLVAIGIEGRILRPFFRLRSILFAPKLVASIVQCRELCCTAASHWHTTRFAQFAGGKSDRQCHFPGPGGTVQSFSYAGGTGLPPNVPRVVRRGHFMNTHSPITTLDLHDYSTVYIPPRCLGRPEMECPVLYAYSLHANICRLTQDFASSLWEFIPLSFFFFLNRYKEPQGLEPQSRESAQ